MRSCSATWKSNGDKSGTGRLALVERLVPIKEVTIISDVAHSIS
jgi:hypothetical protein